MHFFGIIVFSFWYHYLPFQHHSRAEQQVWLPASVPDDLLHLAPGLQSSALWAAETLQCSSSSVWHPAGVRQGEGHSNHSGCLQGMWTISSLFHASVKCHYSQKLIITVHFWNSGSKWISRGIALVRICFHRKKLKLKCKVFQIN